MTQSASFDVVQLANWPATRGLGQDGRARLDDLLGEREGVDLVIDFAGVEAMNISFADEFLGKFLASHDFSTNGTTVKLAGLNADNLYTVVVCVERRGTQVVVVEPDGNLALVGEKMLADTFDKALTLGKFKANDLAVALSLTAQNANNRLKRLAQAGAIRKAQVTGSTRGGREYMYEVLPSEVADPAQLTSA
ncbi:MAG TPA: DUF4325 domain-containing protein [Jatrophihabitans sp.]|jgi:hypothetical protein|uniref:STAS-like domain-containing protein n=1 Tax=Jatrophihabitans sp. TaxID=1932789 RepID=UPI002EFF4F91